MQTVEYIIIFLALSVIIAMVGYVLGAKKKTAFAIFVHLVLGAGAVIVAAIFADINRETIIIATILGAIGVALYFLIA